MAHDVFISYARQDKIVADAITEYLENRGFSCWIDTRDVQPGEIWAKAIITAIRSARVMVLVFSDSSNRSRQVLNEVGSAVDCGIAILPFKVQDVVYSDELGFFIRLNHWLDALTPPLEQHLSRLGDAISILIEVDSTPQEPIDYDALSLKTNPVDGAEMVWIPPGEFIMGDADLADDPRRSVTLSGYWIYKNLVTVAQYKMHCRANGVEMPPAPKFNSNWSQSDHPIVNVSWSDAYAYCEWAGVSLHTEAQWEKVCRGAGGRRYTWGNVFDPTKAWVSKKVVSDAGGTASVGKYGLSPYGCSDMAGNVWQWCADWYEQDYPKSAPASDPKGPASGQLRVLRGGSWYDYLPAFFRASYRYRDVPGIRSYNVGFRCVSRPS